MLNFIHQCYNDFNKLTKQETNVPVCDKKTMASELEKSRNKCQKP